MPKEITPKVWEEILKASDIAAQTLTEDQRRDLQESILKELVEHDEQAPLLTFKASMRNEIEEAFDEAETLVKRIDRFRNDEYFLKANGGSHSNPNLGVLNDTLEQLVRFAEEMLSSQERIEGLKGKPPNNLADDPLAGLFFSLLVIRGKYLKKEPPTSTTQIAATGHHREFLYLCASLCNPAPSEVHVKRAFERAIYWTKNFKSADFWADDFL